MRDNCAITPYQVVKEIERVTEEYPHGENITPLRKIERLLKSIHGLTSYTDEMVESTQRASDTFYARSLGSPLTALKKMTHIKSLNM